MANTGPNFGELKGHGALGLRSNLSPFTELLDQSVKETHILAKVQPVLEVKDWAVSAGTVYVTPFEYTYKGVRRDIVAVSAIGDPELERGESTSLSAGQYYYDPNEGFDQTIFRYDGGVGVWDDGVLKWDQFPKLYVNLTDSSNPSLTTVVAHLGFHFANKAQSHPTLGPERLTNPDLDDWDNSTTVSDYTNASTTDSSRLQTTAVPNSSDYTYSMKLLCANSQAANYSRFYQKFSDNYPDGAYVRCSGWYKTQADYDYSDFVLRIIPYDITDANIIGSDGRSWSSSSDNIVLGETAGEWRRFTFDFRIPHSADNDWQMLFDISEDAQNNDGRVAPIWYAGLSLKRIWRYEFYEPRITQSSIPVSSAGSNDIYFGGKRVSTGTVGFINNDSFWERAVGQLEWINQKCLIMVGGQFMSEPDASGSSPDFQTVGQEILIEDMRTAYTGLMQNVKVNDITANMSLQDLRTYFHTKLPKNLYTDTDFSDLDTKNFQGKVRPLFFGVKTNIHPARIAYESGNSKYGQYEICDTNDAPNGIKAIDSIYAYTNETEAALKNSNKRITLVKDTHYTEDLANGRFTIDVDIGPYEIEPGVNDILNWDEGGAEITANLVEDIYTAASLATEVTTKMTAASGGTVTCSYSDSTNKFTITLNAGTLNLRNATGTNKDKSAYKTLGFTDKDNKTGSLSYAGDEATFTATKTGVAGDVDKDHIIRVDGQGFKDDASGTYTGSANALIEVGADICRLLLLKYMDRPSGSIDTTSFAFARSRAPESLAIYLNESTSTKTIFDRLEFSNVANIVVDGDGTVYYLVYIGIEATDLDDLTQIHDWDIMKFEAEKSHSDVYQTVRVLYDQDPSLSSYRAREAQDTSVAVRLGRQDTREFITYVILSDNAITLSGRMLELSKNAARRIAMDVLGGALIDHKVGDQIAVTRSRSMGASGNLTKAAFRIISIKKNYLKGLVSVDCVDDIATVASKACISSCQTYCESQCQTECELGCELDCEASGCETGCEVACEALCQTDCQLACEPGITCETGCELACQDVCEGSCQACEAASCQEACEQTCQTECELTCQGCHQQTCETVCQQGCERVCELSPCQTACELGTCQNSCELGACEEACEHNCMDQCETTCEDACEADCQTVDEESIP